MNLDAKDSTIDNTNIKESVLIIEDDTITQIVMQKLLQQYNLNISIVSNAYEAMQILDTKDFDTILIDIGLPDVDGKTLSKWIKRINPKQRIIATTAHYNTTKEKIFDDIIIKPITNNDLKKIFNKTSRSIA